LDGAAIRLSRPSYRDDSLKVARAHLDKWKETNQDLLERIRALLRAKTLSEAEVKELIPPAFFDPLHPGLIGKRLALFLQLVWLSATRKVALTFSAASVHVGYYGITEVKVAADALEEFDAMPIPSQRAIKRRGVRILQALKAIWREAAFKETTTSDGGVLMRHVPYVPKTDKQRARMAAKLNEA
jgi:hypothetical protein